MSKFSMDDYIDVAERIMHFHEAYPEGTLQTVSWEVVEVGGKTFVVYRAAAYRTANDKRPGHGTAWEPFPGPTPYTKDSELMNAETAAWGRAIVACGLAANRKIASKQEVKARQGNGHTPPAPSLPQPLVDELVAAKKASGLGDEEIRLQLVALGIVDVPDGAISLKTIKALSEQQASDLLDFLNGS